MENKKPDTQPAEAPAQTKSPLLKIGLGVLMLVVLAGGGFAAWSYFSAKGALSIPTSSAPASPKPVLQDMETFLVNLSDPQGKRYLRLTMQLRLSSPQTAAEFTERKAELRDAVLMLLSSQKSDDISTLSGKMALKRTLMVQMNRMLRQGQVEDIYFTEFLIQ
jgi:flagellar FliL protein